MRAVKNWRAGLLGVVASLLAIYFIASQMKDVGVGQMWQSLLSADYAWVLVSMGIIVIGLFARGARWQSLLGGALPFWRAFSITNVSYLLNNVLPFRVGEVARAYLAMQSRVPVPVMKSVGTILFERLIDVFAVLVILFVGLSTRPLPDEFRVSVYLLVVGLVVGFIAGIAIIFQQERALRLADWLAAHLPVLRPLKPAERLQNFTDGLLPLRNVRSMAQAIGWTVASWACSLSSGYVLMLAVFGQADWATTFVFSAAASLAVAVPAIPGNLGTYEVSIILALRLMGYGDPAATAAVFAIVVHAVNLLVNSALGIIGFIQEGVSLDQLSQGVREMKNPLS